jgi:hypothetical protein
MEVFGTRPKDPGSRTSGNDVVLTTHNNHWTRSCGMYCPMTHRKTYKDLGVARYRWSFLPDDAQTPMLASNGNSASLDDLFNRELVQWQVAPVCHNLKCPGMALYEFRHSYLNV